ncbi:MAG: glycosyltransferase [Candidatus Limiplasma sp.]|nr:glycosyltransferase [Candidatus Limiplasma sp.]
MKRLKYIAYYDTLNHRREKRAFVLAATNKIDYLCAALNRIGYGVDIISMSGTYGGKTCPGRQVELNGHNTLRLFSSLGRGCKGKRILAHMWMQLQMFFFLLTKVKRNEAILVYHSLGYARAVMGAKLVKGFKLILEAEEIYQDAAPLSQGLRRAEYRLFEMADAYIFPTELLENKLNKAQKPSVVIYGTYHAELDRKCGFKDGRTHIAYAGTFDPRKGGAAAAVAAAAFLDGRFHLHILGFGSEKDTEELRRMIAETSRKARCGLTFEGLLGGEDYTRFLQSCQIGLSTQNPDAAFNATSFPSKILSYLANGLHVVSIRIPAVERSAVGDIVTYYDTQTPEEIAKAIQCVDLSKPYDPRKRISQLSAQFQSQLQELLKAVAHEER